jgi:prepilin-type N-terminal cleavage/methylation domain-containing protein
MKKTLARTRFCGFSMVELLATVAVIGIISFLAVPQVTRMRTDAEETLAISRAEALNLAMANLIQTRGRARAITDWTDAASNDGRYLLLRPYIAFAEGSLAAYLPGGYTVTFPGGIEPLTKVTLQNPNATRIYY